MTRRREAQLAAMVDASGAPPEILTFSPQDSARDRWLQRTISGGGAELAALREKLLATGPLHRHSVLLDVNAASGLLTWEAVRRLPEGGVYALTPTPADGQALREQAAFLPEVERPTIWEGEIDDLPGLLAAEPGLRFDAIVGRNALLRSPDKTAALAQLKARLAADGWLSLAERIPRHTQRIHALVDCTALGDDLAARYRAAEEAIYADTTDDLVNWDEETLQVALAELWGEGGGVKVVDSAMELQVTPALLGRWFGSADGGRPSYAQRLAESLSPAEVDAVEALVRGQLLHQRVQWTSRSALITGRTP